MEMNLIHKKVKRRDSDTIWEIVGEDEDTVFIKNYGSIMNNSRMVEKRIFKKYWIVI